MLQEAINEYNRKLEEIQTNPTLALFTDTSFTNGNYISYEDFVIIKLPKNE